jgi:hypothetical protein
VSILFDIRHLCILYAYTIRNRKLGELISELMSINFKLQLCIFLFSRRVRHIIANFAGCNVSLEHNLASQGLRCDCPALLCILSCNCYFLQADTMNFEIVMSALEAVQTSLTIMTGPNMAKQIYKEEVHESPEYL